MEPKNKKKVFKLQSIMKLHNRIVESDLRNIATTMIKSLLTTEQILTNLSEQTEITAEDMVNALTGSAKAIADALSIVTHLGLKTCKVLEAQKPLTFKSEQKELEAFFKLVTTKLETIESDAIKNMKAKFKNKDGECQCFKCRLDRKVKAAKESEPKAKEDSAVTKVKVVEVRVKPGASIEDAVEETINKIKSGEIK